jgi:hypothetical protein
MREKADAIYRARLKKAGAYIRQSGIVVVKNERVIADVEGYTIGKPPKKRPRSGPRDVQG